MMRRRARPRATDTADTIRHVRDEQQLPRFKTAPELESSGAAALDAEGSESSLQSRISKAMVGMKKDFYGKGPTKAKTFFNDEYIFVVMEDGLTRNEQTLLDAGEHDLVRSYRLRFQATMTATTIAAVEEIMGRKVLTYQSQILFDPERAIEIFVLDS